MIDYPWYKIVGPENRLSQGDFFNNCPVIVPCTTLDQGTQELSADVKEYDIVIMSQSCDLDYRKIDLVLVCPVWSLEEFGKMNSYFSGTRGKEALRRGQTTGYHLLKRCELEAFKSDHTVVDFRNVFGVPYDLLIQMSEASGQRLRLLPPYREHLSQAFARFFMRVGLPTDIPSFRK
jgi:hypothetical protein